MLTVGLIRIASPNSPLKQGLGLKLYSPIYLMKQFGYLFYNPHCRWKETHTISNGNFKRKEEEE
jgi:hypothetical protein